eukprot:3290267-Pleurochrysis_carterae.AAC.1
MRYVHELRSQGSPWPWRCRPRHAALPRCRPQRPPTTTPPYKCGRPHLACVRGCCTPKSLTASPNFLSAASTVQASSQISPMARSASISSPTSSSMRVTSRETSSCLAWMTEAGIRPLPGRDPR